MSTSVFKHAGNFYDQEQRNNRLTFLLVSAFILYSILLGYGIDAVVFRNDPIGVIHPSGDEIPWATVIAFLLAGAYALYCFYRGDELVLKSVRADSLFYEPEIPVVERIWHDNKEHEQLVNVVGEMSIAAGISMPAIYVIRDIDPNAFATGRDPGHASIAVTRGLLQKLDREQMQAVIAHEIAHIRNRDTRLMTLVSTLAMGSFLLMTYSGVRSLARIAALPFWLALALFTALSVRVLELLISDERIYQADVTAVELTRNPNGVLRALTELDFYTGATQSFPQGIGSLCVMGPVGEYQRMDNAGFAFRFCLKSHPPMAKRIEAIKEMSLMLASAAARPAQAANLNREP